LKREAALLAAPHFASACGDAPTLSARLSELQSTSAVALVVSWGVCGGLDPRLRPGDVVVGSEAVSDGERIPIDPLIASSIERRLVGTGARVAVGTMASVSAPVLTPREKKELRGATGAAAVDMESAIAGRFAIARRTPFAILRAVADPADRDLPALVVKAVDPEGRINVAAVILELAREPWQFPKVLAAARDGRAAFAALGRARGPLAGALRDLGLSHL